MQAPGLQIRHKDPGDWIVAVLWPGGQVQDAGTFKTEYEANEWIAKEMPSWLKAQQRTDESGS